MIFFDVMPMLSRILHLLRKELIEFRRDRLLFFVVMVIPVIEMSSLAYATSGGVAHLPTVVSDQSQTRSSRELVSALRNSESFVPDQYTDGSRAAAGRLLEGSARVAVVIPANFAQRMGRPDRPAEVQVLLDGTEPVTALVAQAYAEETILRFAEDRLARRVPSMPTDPIDARVRVLFNESMRGENFYIPGELADILAALVIVLTAIALSRERERGTIEQLMVTPLRPIELIVGKALPAMFVAYSQFLIMLAVALFWFRVPLHGSASLLLVLAVFFVTVEAGWGMLLSSLSWTQGQALVTAFFYVSVETVVSGYMIPPEQMPVAAQWFSRIFPLRYFIAILRGIFLRGATLADLWPEVLALAVLGIGVFALATYRLSMGNSQ